MAERIDTWVKDWSGSPGDPLCLRAYALPSDDLFLTVGSAFRPLRVWRGPPTDRIRLDCTSASVPATGGGVPLVRLRVSALGGCLPPGFVGASGQWTIAPSEPTGALVQVSGLLCDAWMLEGFIDVAAWGVNGPAFKIGIRALVDRIGGPQGIVRGMLLP